MNTFTVGSVTLEYRRDYFNEAFANERSVEVALGRWFLGHIPQPLHAVTPPVIEVGCVLPYYGMAQHEIVDIADEHPANRKVDALTLDYAHRNVLSISTVEHMQRSEYGNQTDEDGITFIQKVAASADRWLITWGVGYNPVLDKWVRESALTRTFLKRANWKNEYRQVEESGELWSAPFGHSDRPIPESFFNNANVVVLLTNVPDLLVRS